MNVSEYGLVNKQATCKIEIKLILANWRASTTCCIMHTGSYEKSVRVTQPVTKSNSSLLSALQTSQVHQNSHFMPKAKIT